MNNTASRCDLQQYIRQISQLSDCVLKSSAIFIDTIVSCYVCIIYINFTGGAVGPFLSGLLVSKYVDQLYFNS